MKDAVGEHRPSADGFAALPGPFRIHIEGRTAIQFEEAAPARLCDHGVPTGQPVAVQERASRGSSNAATVTVR